MDCHVIITSLDLSNNTALTGISASYNQIVTIDVSNCTILESLRLGHNQLTSLDVSNNTLLDYLECNHSQLTSLDISNNMKLYLLECQVNQLVMNLDVSNHEHLRYLQCWGNQLSRLNMGNHLPANVNLNCADNLPHLNICVGDPIIVAASAAGAWTKDATATYTKDCLPLAVEGRIVIDNNTNCIADSLENGLKGVLVKFQKGNDIIYANSYDMLGNYQGYLDTGTYSVSIIPPSYWQSCPSNQQITVNNTYNLQTLDWTLQPLISCPMLEVDISAPFLRMTGGGSYYTISYCNKGTLAAQNAYVEVDLDPYLNVLGSSIPISSQNGNIYTFNIGNLDVGHCGDFSINVLVDTSAQFEQTHCTEVRIAPDSICIPNFWSGPIVETEASCQNDSVYFKVNNTGAAMTQAHNYFVFEDDVAMRTGTVQLGAGATVNIIQGARMGSTYRIEVEQLPSFPALLGDSVASSAIEGCNPLPNGRFNTGFITQFSNGNRSPLIAIDCQQNIASYDPNDKAAQPAGYGASNYIYKNTALDYKIRFQNTGTDTAFNIVILDTLSSFIDITSLRMGASSHAYSWTIKNGNVLKVSFDNIMLVDSNANEPLSHGFFKYRVEQKANNPLESIIENRAAIYFDYNPAIFTNTTFHTIGENFVPIKDSDKGDFLVDQVTVKVYPNPFQNQTTFEIKGGDYQQIELNVYDITGRTVQQVISADNKILLNRANMQQGLYIYQLIGDGQLINTGKVIAQ
ncbi:MAG: T9SS type A sorting domain-containing protein [Aureispira sp.]|nr:T9SS type A sorting domain-containing protein [Aureispira sp.]